MDFHQRFSFDEASNGSRGNWTGPPEFTLVGMLHYVALEKNGFVDKIYLRWNEVVTVEAGGTVH
jgi:hypothetical protein